MSTGELGCLLLSYKCFWVNSTFEIIDLDPSILDGLIGALETLHTKIKGKLESKQ